VYGVVEAGAVGPLPNEGVQGGAVDLVEADGLAAVVTRLNDGSFRARRRDLGRHLDVLRHIGDQTTVLPCSFGSVLPTEEAVRRHVLEARRADLLDELRRLEGRVQLNVKAHYDEDTVLGEIVRDDAEIARLRERTRNAGAGAYYENIRMGELVAAALAARRSRDAGRILERLEREAEAAAVEDVDGLLVLKGSFLVAPDRRDRFDAALDAVAAEEAPRLRLEVIGPLPPTAFVSLGVP
jgi:hypothetical protein